MTHEALLRALPAGGVIWLAASGKSLWPLLRSGDSLRVRRTDADGLTLGDVAVVKLPGGVLAAHLVVALQPVRTASSVGIEDAPATEVLGVVTAFRRDGVVREWPRGAARVLRWLPVTSRWLKRVPGLRRVVCAFRD